MSQIPSNKPAATVEAPVEAQAKAAKSAAKTAAKAEETIAEAVSGLDMAVPEAVRSMAERAVTQSREAYEKAKDTLEEAVETLELSLDKAGQGAVAINRKVIDMAQTNLNSGFDLAKDLAGAKNLTQIVELQAAFARKQFQAVMAQAQEIRELSAKVATESTEPFKSHMTRSMEMFKHAS